MWSVFINNTKYILDLVEMTQLNFRTGRVRKIKRNSKIQSPYKKLKALWTWHDDFNTQIPYDIKIMNDLETEFGKKKTIVKMKFNSFDYNMDLKNMLQVNTHTKKARNIRRIPMDLLVNDVVWKWNDKGKFTDYDSSTADAIEKSFLKGDEEFKKGDLIINYKHMNQKNNKTGEIVNIQRIEGSLIIPKDYLWQYLTDYGYISYSNDLNRSIEENYTKGNPSIPFSIDNVHYEIKSATMEQEDIETQCYRAIRRITPDTFNWSHYEKLEKERILPKVLKSDSKEYIETKKYFDKTMSGKYKNIKIMDISKPKEESKVELKAESKEESKKESKEELKEELKEEMKLVSLFYGNQEIKPSSIYNTKNKVLSIEGEWGKGIYLYKKASEAELYEANATCFLFMVEANLSKPLDCKNIKNIPMTLPKEYNETEHDSLIIQKDGSDICVAFNEDKVSLKYLIEFS